MSEGMVKTQIELPKNVDRMLKILKVELDLSNKSEAVEFVVEAFRGEFRPEIEVKFAEAMARGHEKVSARRARSLKKLNEAMDKW